MNWKIWKIWWLVILILLTILLLWTLTAHAEKKKLSDRELEGVSMGSGGAIEMIGIVPEQVITVLNENLLPASSPFAVTNVRGPSQILILINTVGQSQINIAEQYNVASFPVSR
jgi:hypothetical protein